MLCDTYIDIWCGIVICMQEGVSMNGLAANICFSLSDEFFMSAANCIFTTMHGMPAWTRYEKAVCLSNTCIVTKQKKDLSRFLYHMQDHLF